MPETTPLPYGFVVGRFVGHDGEPVAGEVRFTPITTTHLPEATPPAIATPRVVVAAIGPDGGVGPVALVPAVYEVSPHIVGASVARYALDVRAEHTLDNPADLTLEAPLQPSPSVRFVVNETAHREALAARAVASLAADEARKAAAQAQEAASSSTDESARATDAAAVAVSARNDLDEARTVAIAAAERAARYADDVQEATFRFSLDPDDPTLVVVDFAEFLRSPDDPFSIRIPVG